MRGCGVEGRGQRSAFTAFVIQVIFESCNLCFTGSNSCRQCIKCFCQSCAWERSRPFVFCADGILSHRRRRQLKCLPGYFRGANVTPCLSWACCNTCTSETHLATESGARLHKSRAPRHIWIVMQVAAAPVSTEVSRVPQWGKK